MVLVVVVVVVVVMVAVVVVVMVAVVVVVVVVLMVHRMAMVICDGVCTTKHTRVRVKGDRITTVAPVYELIPFVNREHRAESREQGAESREQRADRRGQKAESREQREEAERDTRRLMASTFKSSFSSDDRIPVLNLGSALYSCWKRRWWWC
jgi:hypothetical protein